MPLHYLDVADENTKHKMMVLIKDNGAPNCACEHCWKIFKRQFSRQQRASRASAANLFADAASGAAAAVAVAAAAAAAAVLELEDCRIL